MLFWLLLAVCRRRLACWFVDVDESESLVVALIHFRVSYRMEGDDLGVFIGRDRCNLHKLLGT
jgi:hypothetical protein